MKEYASLVYPNRYARAGGAAYLIIIIAGLLGEMFVRGSLVVAGNPAATAGNIIAHPLLWRAGIAGDLLMHICDVILMLALYVLLKPVNRRLALMALLFTLVQTAVLVANKFNLVMPLFLLGGADYFKTLDPEQVQALSYLFIRVHSYGFGIGLIFFGFTCMILGYLIFKSGYLPRWIGILMPIGGLCYIVNSFALILYPPLADLLFPAILLPPFVAETSLCLWLLLKGVNMDKWKLRISEVMQGY